MSSASAAAAPSAPGRTAASSSSSSRNNSTEGTWVADIDKVLAYARQELSGLIATSSPTTKTICAVLGVSYVVNFIAPWVADYFALVPERTIPCVWNIVTAGYYEMSVVGAAVDMLGVMYLGRLVEPIWGASEFIHFVVVVNLCVGACTFVTMYTLYIVTRSQFYLFAKFSGFHGILAALMVALRQLLPEERVPLPPPLGSVLRVRNKHLPGLYCVATAALCVVSGAEHHHIGLYLFVAFGAYSGWCYLRYFQSRSITARGGGGLLGRGSGGDEDDDDIEGGGGGSGGGGAAADTRRGDDSEEFAFAAQFPVFLQPLLRRLTDPCHALFCAPPASSSSGGGGGGGGHGYGRGHGHGHNKRAGGHHSRLHHQGAHHHPMEPPSGGAAADKEEETVTERRKELASRGARLLEERMARASAKGTSSSSGAAATAVATPATPSAADQPAAAGAGAPEK